MANTNTGMAVAHVLAASTVWETHAPYAPRVVMVKAGRRDPAATVGLTTQCDFLFIQYLGADALLQEHACQVGIVDQAWRSAPCVLLAVLVQAVLGHLCAVACVLSVS